MFTVQLLRESVHERISAAAGDFLLQLEKGEEAAELPVLRALLTERLTAAADEIVALLEETVAEYEDRVQRSEREIYRQKRLLDAVLKPEVRLHRADVHQLLLRTEEVLEQQQWSSGVDQEDLEPPHIKEEQEELWSSQGGEQLQGLEEAEVTRFSFTTVIVKPQHMETEADGDHCGGSEAASNRDDPLSLTHHGTSHSDPETEDSGDWKDTRGTLSGFKSLKKNSVSEHDTGVEDRRFSCSECSRRFTQTKNLRIHMRTHTGEKPFVCSVCHKGFTQHGTLTRHMMLHTGEKPFICSVCGKGLRSKQKLHEHIMYHTGEKPFGCSFCGKGFIKRGDLVVHVRSHTGVKPFTCSVCGKGFTQKGHMTRHMATHNC